ncbi:hypothetical protein [Streptomyces sp. NPDC056244]|uniref:hypothetical protein n=1 Tax=unclassified Streptomyces TaxID=2593676 RepID=UPI0035D81BD6
MNTALRITAFAAMLAAAFGVAYGVGNAVDPITADPRPAKHAPAPTAPPTGTPAPHEGSGGHTG